MDARDAAWSAPPEEPEWVRRHGLQPGRWYVTRDSDLSVEYVGLAQVKDAFGYRLVMVLRELGRPGHMLTLDENDAGHSAGFRPLDDGGATEPGKAPA